MHSNKTGSLRRLDNLARKLEKQDLLERYDEAIQEQIKEEIVENADEEVEPQRREFYILHKPVIRESAETTKQRIVYDASAKENTNCPSLNECLETGLPFTKQTVASSLTR